MPAYVASEPTFRLVRTHLPVAAAPALDADQQRVLGHPGGVLRVLAGPGTGKTTTLVESVVERVTRRGVPIENILLLTFSRRAAGQLRDQVTARLQRTVAEPVARTFHSYAFGVVRRAAVLAGDPPPRLLSGSEQDVTLRELLAGRLADRTDGWPAELSAAVHTQAFAEELRDLLMRAIERDVSPQALAALGTEHHRPDWLVAADVLREYLEVTALKAPGAFDAAELIQRASAELRRNPELLAAERRQRRRIFVDEYQDTDPAQLELLKLIAVGAEELVLIGDPDQAIYSFRGAEQSAMADIAMKAVVQAFEKGLRQSRVTGQPALGLRVAQVEVKPGVGGGVAARVLEPVGRPVRVELARRQRRAGVEQVAANQPGLVAAVRRVPGARAEVAFGRGRPQNSLVNSQYKQPDSSIATGRVSTQAISRLRSVAICRPEPLAAMVPATPDDSTWVVDTGRP